MKGAWCRNQKSGPRKLPLLWRLKSRCMYKSWSKSPFATWRQSKNKRLRRRQSPPRTTTTHSRVVCVCVCVFSIDYLHGIARSQRNCTQTDKRMIGLLLHAAKCGLKNCLRYKIKMRTRHWTCRSFGFVPRLENVVLFVCCCWWFWYNSFLHAGEFENHITFLLFFPCKKIRVD